ncbi:CopG family transcriptional regulator [archaeon]|jgi:hypothetical protein|nr:CopG family transcriptional regulator [archaeon]
MVKRVISFTVDEDLFSAWKKYAKKKSVNSSQLVEKFLRNYLKNRK